MRNILGVAVCGGGRAVGADNAKLRAAVEKSPAKFLDAVGNNEAGEGGAAAKGGVVNLDHAVGDNKHNYLYI